QSQGGWTTPADLAALSADLGPTLAAVASPTPNLRAWTLGAFEPQPGPGGGGSIAGGLQAALPGGAAGPTVAVTPTPAGAGVQVIDFDADSAPDSGDLGKFLASQVKPESRRVVVNAHGNGGWRPFSPIRMAEGVSLELFV